MQQLSKDQAADALRRIPFYLVDDADGETPLAGVTLSAGDLRISKNGAAEANHAGTWAEVAGGLYYYQATIAELDTLGFLTLRLSKAGVQAFVALAQVSLLHAEIHVAKAGIANKRVIDRTNQAKTIYDDDGETVLAALNGSQDASGLIITETPA